MTEFGSILLGLPLFQGVAVSDLDRILAHTRFNFNKFEAGETIIKRGANCQGVYIIINGRVRLNARAHDGSYSVSESIKGPWLCEIERLFGREPVYRYSYTAETNTSTVFIAKRELLKMCSEIDVVRLNMLNLYTGLAQKGRDRLWLQREGGTAEHITRWFKEHCLYPAGEKLIHIRMVDLAREVNDSRLDVSIALNKMVGEGLLELGRGKIKILALEKFRI